jgi:quinol monooxygenase YgiN
MIMARTVIQTKWGKADKVVEGMKEMMKSGPMPEGGHKVTLMTDLSGEFHTVVMEGQFDSLAAWEKYREQMFSGQEGEGDGQGGGQDNMEEMMVSGRQEFYKIEAEF